MSDEVLYSGPVFDGRAAEDLRRGIDHARDQVAEAGRRKTAALLASRIRENRGVAVSRVMTVKGSRTITTPSGHKTYSMFVSADAATQDIVTIDLASYGPWLEGTGSRNETTRFKGYHAFRQAGQDLDRDAAGMVGEALTPYVAEAND